MASAKEQCISSGINLITLPIISIAVAITHASLFPSLMTSLLDAECTVTANKHNHIQSFQSVWTLSLWEIFWSTSKPSQCRRYCWGM